MLQSEYHLDDKVKSKLLDIISPEDARAAEGYEISKAKFVSPGDDRDKKMIDDLQEFPKKQGRSQGVLGTKSVIRFSRRARKLPSGILS